MQPHQVRCLSDLFNRPPFYLGSAFDIHPKISSILRRVIRVPHRFAHVYWTTVTDEQLDELKPRVGRESTIHGEGCSIDSPQEAITISVYEATERLFSVHVDDELVRGSFFDFRPSAVHPGEFILPREWEYEQCSYTYVRYHESLSLHWFPVYQITQDEVVPRLIPASLAVTGFSLRCPDERFVPILSTGFAAGTRFAQTILRGIYEVVERDAFMIAWLNRLSCPRLQVRSTSSSFFESLRQLSDEGFAVDFVDLTTDLKIPVILTVIEHRVPELKPNNCKVFGLGCHLNPERALVKSYIEALRMMLNYYEFEEDEVRVRNLDLYANNPFFDESYFQKTSFLNVSSEVKPLEQMPNQATDDHESDLRICLSALNGKEADVYFADFTPAELRDSSYCLTRVFISKLQPHLYEHDFWRLDNPRITQAPVAMGHRNVSRNEGELNLLPNPFSLR